MIRVFGAIAIFAASFSVQASVSLCEDLVDRVQTKYASTIYNLTSRIDDLEQNYPGEELERLAEFKQLRDKAVALDNQERTAEIRRCEQI